MIIKFGSKEEMFDQFVNGGIFFPYSNRGSGQTDYFDFIDNVADQQLSEKDIVDVWTQTHKEWLKVAKRIIKKGNTRVIEMEVENFEKVLNATTDDQEVVNEALKLFQEYLII